MKILFIIASLIIINFIVSVGLTRSERVECIHWAAQGHGLVGWYSTDWQRMQCHARGVLLPDVARYVETLKVEAPETLREPIRAEFDTEENYKAALDRFHSFGYWATEAK